MKKKISAIKIITLVVCILLVISGGVLTLTGGGTRFLMRGNARVPAGFENGKINGNGLPPPGDFQPGQGNGQFSQPGENFTPPDMNGEQGNWPGNIQGSGPRAGMSSTQMKLISLLRYSAGGGVILFGILAAIGIWEDKKWGKVMAVICAVIILAYTVPSMFTMARGMSIIESILKILLSLTLVVLVFLPQKKTQKELPVQSTH